MKNFLQTGLSGRGFKATLKLYLFTVVIIGALTSVVCRVTDADTAFRSIPYLSVAVVLVEYAYAHRVFARLWHRTPESPQVDKHQIQVSNTAFKTWSLGLYVVECLKCIVKPAHDGFSREERRIMLSESFAMLSDGEADAAFVRGRAMFALGQYEKALRYLADAKDNEQTWVERGLALDGLKRFGDALAAYDCAIQLNKWSASAYLNKGTTFVQLGEDKEALVSYKRAVKNAFGDVRIIEKANRSIRSLEKKLDISSEEVYVSQQQEQEAAELVHVE